MVADNTPQPQSLEEQWTEFQALVLTPTAPLAQRHAMRVAFFTGAQSALLAMTIATKHLSPDEGRQYMTLLQLELAAFAASMKAGGR